MKTRTVVAVHGVTAGGDRRTVGYTKATQKAIRKFTADMGTFQVPIVEAPWADLSQKYSSTPLLATAQRAVLKALSGATLGLLPGVLSWFDVPSMADVADMIADVFIYDGAERTAKIRGHVRKQVLSARAASGRGVVLHGNSLGSVIAVDIVAEMLRRGEMGPGVDVARWPVRALLTTGSPLGIDVPGISGFTDRARILASLLPKPLAGFAWHNLYDRNDPIVSGSLLGLSQGATNLSRHRGYQRLGVFEATPQAGFHLQAHTGYWKHPIVAQTLFQLANLS